MQSLKSILLLFSLIIACESRAQCPMVNVTLTTQAQVDAFPANYPGCTVFPGFLNIIGTDITNLTGLSGITSVGGQLYISNNPMLTNVDGLSNLIYVGGILFFNQMLC